MDPMSELPEYLPDCFSSTSTSDSAESSEIEPTADSTVEAEPVEDLRMGKSCLQDIDIPHVLEDLRTDNRYSPTK